jgi:hypothetical protein
VALNINDWNIKYICKGIQMRINTRIIIRIFTEVIALGTFLALSLLPLSSSFAEGYLVDKYIFEKNKRIVTDISGSSYTRITFEPFYIKEVIGDKEKYKVIVDSLGKNIFLIPKNNKIPNIDLSIVTSSGATQDMTLNIKDIHSKSIIIERVSDKKINEFELSLESEKLLKSMIKNEKGKYYVEHHCNYINSVNRCPKLARTAQLDSFKDLDAQYDIRLISSYKFAKNNLSGYILAAKTISQTPIEISNQILADIFSTSRLVFVNSLNSLKDNFHKAYIVIHEEDKE